MEGLSIEELRKRAYKFAGVEKDPEEFEYLTETEALKVSAFEEACIYVRALSEKLAPVPKPVEPQSELYPNSRVGDIKAIWVGVEEQPYGIGARYKAIVRHPNKAATYVVYGENGERIFTIEGHAVILEHFTSKDFNN